MTQGSIPHPTTSYFLNLHIREKEKERLLNESERITRRIPVIKRRLQIVDQEIKRLFKLATGKEWIKAKESSTPFSSEGSEAARNPTSIGY